MAGPAHSLPALLQPPLALGGIWAAHSQPPILGLSEGVLLCPRCHAEFWEVAFVSTSSAELGWLLGGARGEALQGAHSVY